MRADELKKLRDLAHHLEKMADVHLQGAAELLTRPADPECQLKSRELKAEAGAFMRAAMLLRQHLVVHHKVDR